jgi:hypothetical protein
VTLVTPPTGRCRGCDLPMTWAEQRRQFGRAIKTYGVDPEMVKALGPRCGKCTTKLHSTWRRSLMTRKQNS